MQFNFGDTVSVRYIGEYYKGFVIHRKHHIANGIEIGIGEYKNVSKSLTKVYFNTNELERANFGSGSPEIEIVEWARLLIPCRMLLIEKL